jgi:predicted O-methyltransferase YrrM
MTGQSLIRRLFFRSSGFRWLVGRTMQLRGMSLPLKTAHLQAYRESRIIGPLQQDEAVLLFGLVRTLRPQTLVEFGFYHGHSSFNFLQAMEPEARLFSYDIAPESIKRAREEFPPDPRFTFLAKSQTEFSSQDVEGRLIDFVFFDAAHLLTDNQQAWQAILPHLAPFPTIAIHDTGLWATKHMESMHREFLQRAPDTSISFVAHQEEEREFVRWILSTHPEWSAVHFHSTQTLRHGLTILQRNTGLNSNI